MGQEVGCDFGEPESIEGCSKEQQKILRSRKRPPGETNECRWKNMYRTLFPDIPDTGIPSPCNTSVLFWPSLNANKLIDHLVPHVDVTAVLEITNAFSQFFNDEFSKRFTDTYSLDNMIKMRETVERHTNDVIREYQEMEALSHAASQAHTTGKRPIISSRKKPCTTVFPTMRDERTTTDGHRLLPTNPSLAFTSYSQSVPQGDNLNYSAISNMYEFTNQSRSNVSSLCGSSVLQPPIGEEYHFINPSSSAHLTAPQNSQDDFQHVNPSDIIPYNGYGLNTIANFDQLRFFNQDHNPMSSNTSSVESYSMLPTPNSTQSDALNYNDQNMEVIDNEAKQSLLPGQNFQYPDQQFQSGLP